MYIALKNPFESSYTRKVLHVSEQSIVLKLAIKWTFYLGLVHKYMGIFKNVSSSIIKKISVHTKTLKSTLKRMPNQAQIPRMKTHLANKKYSNSEHTDVKKKLITANTLTL